MHDDFYQMYLQEMKELPAWGPKEQERLLKEARQGNKEAKQRLVEANLPFALELAREFEGKGVLLTDLVQEANMALVAAVKEYTEGEQGEALSGSEALEAFRAYAKQKLNAALSLCMEEESSAKENSEELTARVNVLLQVSRFLFKELGREATVKELAQKMKMTEPEVRKLMKMTMDAMSLTDK